MANHVVKSLKFEINVATQSDFEQVSAEIPELVKSSVSGLIDQIFSELYPSHHLLVIDKLEIDLGYFQFVDLKNELLQKFRGEFRKAFNQHLQSAASKITSAQDLPFLILDEYIRRGVRPNWLLPAEGSFRDHLAKAFSKNPKKFSNQLRGYVKNPTHKKRLLENFSEEILVKTVLVDNPQKENVPFEEIAHLKTFFREQYRHLDAHSVSLMFKSMLLDLLANPNRINQFSSFRASVVDALEIRFGSEVATSYLSGMDKSSNFTSTQIINSKTSKEKEGIQPLPGLGLGRDELLEKFQFFLVHGFTLTDSRSSSYRFRNINTLFGALLSRDFDGLVAFLLKYGKTKVIKKRFLDSLSQDAILSFFSRVAPQKRKLLEWAVDVFEQVQEEYQPINQTNIQVKKSINEITFDLFLNKNLQTISDENYLRLLFKKTALKYGVGYKNLLFLTLKAISSPDKKYQIFNLNQTLGDLYAKDVLRRQGLNPTDWLLFSSNEKEQDWRTNYQNKEELMSLFTGLYQDQYGVVPATVTAWLQTKIQTLSLTSATRLFELWEEFSEKYSIPPGELLIPLLLEKKSNASLKITDAEFNFWIKKYGIQGIFPRKSVDIVQLLTFLYANKKMVSTGMLKKIALGLPIAGAISKQLCLKVAELLRPSLSTVLPGYLLWIEQLLIKNKAESLEVKLFTWLYHQLILLPQSQLSLTSLQEKAEEFLNLNERIVSAEEVKPSSLRAKMPLIKKGRQKSNSAMLAARIFGILGFDEIYGIFPEAKRYDEEILLKLLTSKYAKSFYKLVQMHRYNPEFQDAILIQSPKWLKKQFLDFLSQYSSFDWNASIADFTSYFEETKWVKLEGPALESFLEKILWKEIFEEESFARDEVALVFLENAWDSQLIADKFWEDLQGYSQKSEQEKDIKNTKSLSNLATLEQTNGFTSFVSRSSKKKEETSILPILESLVYESTFPVAHPFEGNSSEEFIDYNSRLAAENKNEFLNFFSTNKHPYFIRKYFNLLKYEDLLGLIKEKHIQAGLAISVDQLEKIVKIYKVQDQEKIEIFLRAWLVFLFQSTAPQLATSSLVVAIGEILLEEGILEKNKVDSSSAFAQLAKFSVWNEEEKNHFFEQARLWESGSTPPAPILKLTTDEQIYSYFKSLNDPNLKGLKGKAFLKNWLMSFFDSASISDLKAFVEVYKNSFYENSYGETRKRELFFKRFFQLKDGYNSFLEALSASPQVWPEFRQNSPKIFEQYAQDASPRPKQMSLIELLNFFLAHGVLPKEEGSLQAFAKRIMELKGTDLANLRGIVLASLSDFKKKKNLTNLLRYVNEKWFFSLLHPKLSSELEKLAEEVRKRTGSDFFTDLNIQNPVDRILFFADSLSKMGSSKKHFVELLLPVFELWMDSKSKAVITAMFRSGDQKAEVLVMLQHASRKVKKALEDNSEKKKEEEPPVVQAEEVNLGEGVSISNAGMILCWPFFGRFFGALGLVEQGKFKGQQAEERAVQLLQYLATGLTSFEEWDLSLNKVLCGVPLNMPISPNLEITTEEEELVKKLINGTIFNWEKMRGTRLETFRETFFMRQGMLYEKDNRWELFVDRKAYDVLMDTLTWNISMINLSWMKKRLNVQWK